MGDSESRAAGADHEAGQRVDRAGCQSPRERRPECRCCERAEPDATEQQTVARRPEAKSLAGDQWQQRPDRTCEEHESNRPSDQREQDRRVGNEAATGTRRGDDVLAGESQLALRHRGHRHGAEHRYERDRVRQEHHSRAAHGKQQTADCRADCARQVLVDRAEHDRLSAIGGWDKLRLERLPCRCAERAADPDHEQQAEQYTGRQPAGRRGDGQADGGTQHRYLRHEDQLAPIDEVPECPRGHCQQQHRQARRGGDRAQQQC